MQAALPRRWQADASCLAFGGSPDLNDNGIPDFVYAVSSGAFVPNPAEPDADRDGVMDVWQQDTDGDGLTDAEAYLDGRQRSFAVAGVDPQADDDGDGTPNETDEWLADFDGDGIVNFNDATPCGSPKAEPHGAAGGLAVVPSPVPMDLPPLVPAAPPPAGGAVPMEEPEPRLQLAGLDPVPVIVPAVADAPPLAMLVPPQEQPLEFDRALLAAANGDVDVDSDNTHPKREPDHGASEERAEDGGDGVIVAASSADTRVAVPLDVQLRAVTASTRVRFRSVAGVFVLYGGDPCRRSWVPQVLFGEEYGAAESGFVAGRYRRFHVEALRGGRDAITVEIDPAGDGSWSVVDGVVLTGREAEEAGPLVAGPAQR